MAVWLCKCSYVKKGILQAANSLQDTFLLYCNILGDNFCCETSHEQTHMLPISASRTVPNKNRFYPPKNLLKKHGFRFNFADYVFIRLMSSPDNVFGGYHISIQEPYAII